MKTGQAGNKREKSEAELFFNRTGIMTNPDMSAELIRGAKKTIPSSSGSGKEAIASRAQYSINEFLIGSSPSIVVDGGNASQDELSANADRISVLLDKLGERLAFERQGTRLYEAFLQKLETAPAQHINGPSSEDLRHICDEELQHFKLLQKAITEVGGDATIQTPSADVAGVLSHGVFQIVSDRRTTIPQTLQAMLTAELADNDGWQMLKELSGKLEYSDLEEECEKAFREEQEHLKKVRQWLSDMTLTEAVGDQDSLRSESEDSGPENGGRRTHKHKRSHLSRSSRGKKRRKK
jgi:rubrerythrin